MKKAVLVTALVALYAVPAAAGIWCSAAKAFKYQSWELNANCAIEAMYDYLTGW